MEGALTEVKKPLNFLVQQFLEGYSRNWKPAEVTVVWSLCYHGQRLPWTETLGACLPGPPTDLIFTVHPVGVAEASSSCLILTLLVVVHDCLLALRHWLALLPPTLQVSQLLLTKLSYFCSSNFPRGLERWLSA